MTLRASQFCEFEFRRHHLPFSHVFSQWSCECVSHRPIGRPVVPPPPLITMSALCLFWGSKGSAQASRRTMPKHGHDGEFSIVWSLWQPFIELFRFWRSKAYSTTTCAHQFKREIVNRVWTWLGVQNFRELVSGFFREGLFHSMSISGLKDHSEI